jgi:hypothetical protein
MPILRVMEVDGIISEFRSSEDGDRSITRQQMVSLKRDNESHYNENDRSENYCSFCFGSKEIITIE